MIELLIVVAIIGILAAVALPAYKDYSLRAKMSEVILAAGNCKTTISETFQTGSGSLIAAGSWGCETDPSATEVSKYVLSIDTLAGGIIEVTTQNLSVGGTKVTIAPSTSSSAFTAPTALGQDIAAWRCGNTTDGTDVSSNYLPASCRGNL